MISFEFVAEQSGIALKSQLSSKVTTSQLLPSSLYSSLASLQHSVQKWTFCWWSQLTVWIYVCFWTVAASGLAFLSRTLFSSVGFLEGARISTPTTTLTETSLGLCSRYQQHVVVQFVSLFATVAKLPSSTSQK